MKIPCLFHPEQLLFKPVYEWAFGDKIDHPETTARAENILGALRANPDLFEIEAPKSRPLSALRDAHSYNLLTLYNTARQLPEGETFYPSVFPREGNVKGDGNGTQSMFYRDDRVLSISIHGDPREFYPFYSGFATETGAGKGEGYNLNFPLPAKTSFAEWMQVFEQNILPAVRHFSPEFLILAAGFDTFVKDPIGDFTFATKDYETIGAHVKALNLPTLVVQEGGYYTPDLGANVVSLLRGLA